jgi:hypothetical protein
MLDPTRRLLTMSAMAMRYADLDAGRALDPLAVPEPGRAAPRSSAPQSRHERPLGTLQGAARDRDRHVQRRRPRLPRPAPAG